MNNTRKQEVPKKLKKEDGQAWKDNEVVYIECYRLRILELVKRRNLV